MWIFLTTFVDTSCEDVLQISMKPSANSSSQISVNLSVKSSAETSVEVSVETSEEICVKNCWDLRGGLCGDVFFGDLCGILCTAFHGDSMVSLLSILGKLLAHGSSPY